MRKKAVWNPWLLIALLTAVMPLVMKAAELPKVGDHATDFTLKTLDNKPVRLSELTASNDVVLVVLRGWPGYQCPLCTKQVHDFVTVADSFSKAKARVLMIYPGPAKDLQTHAQEFLGQKQWPTDFLYVIDPDYTMINAYGLRWDKAGETAYPSTFVIDRKGDIRFAKISKSHGDRAKASEVLEVLPKVSTARP